MIARWVSHELTDENRRKRVEDCHENLKMFREGKWRLCSEIIYKKSIGNVLLNFCIKLCNNNF